MNLLFTGASGFLGQNIIHLLERNYDVKTIGITESDDYKTNLLHEEPVLHESYDIVLHAAGKAHSIPKTEEEKKLFYDLNYEGTKRICSALEKVAFPKAFIFISTVAVYGCESGWNIDESYPLNGSTPYALSKIKAEQYLQKWCDKHNIKLSILRPSLLAGSMAPGNLGAMVKGISSGRYLRIGKGSARKSILMARDIANLIPKLVNKGGGYIMYVMILILLLWS